MYYCLKYNVFSHFEVQKSRKSGNYITKVSKCPLIPALKTMFFPFFKIKTKRTLLFTNLLICLTPSFSASAGRVIGGKPGTFVAQTPTAPGKAGTGGTSQSQTVVPPATAAKPGGGGPKAPQFLQKLQAIRAKPGENVTFSVEFDGEPAPAISVILLMIFTDNSFTIKID